MRGMKCGMTIEYLKCRADLNFEVDFEVNDVTGTIVTKRDLHYSYNGLFSSIIIFFPKYALYAFKHTTMWIVYMFVCLS